jgi:hypothetical protein
MSEDDQNGWGCLILIVTLIVCATAVEIARLYAP